MAIKILNKHATENEEESIAHESSAQSRLWGARLSDAGYTSHPGYTHCLVMSPGSSFSETSVHGKHQCYVSTSCGTTVGQILDTTGRPFSLSATKRIVKQALLALDFVHTKAKIVHCGTASVRFAGGPALIRNCRRQGGQHICQNNRG